MARPDPIHLARRTAIAVRRQVPDDALRAGRRLVGNASLHRAVDRRVVLVFDAGAGLGRDVALRLGGAGATVLLAGHDEGGLQEAADAIAAGGGVADVLPFDAGEPDAATRVAARAVDAHGGVDVLINAPHPPAERARADEPGAGALAQRAVEAGYFAPVRLILALVPAMRLNHRGHVVNVCLSAGGAREHGCAPQIAASAALDAFGRCLAPELDDARIPITAVHVPLDPGPEDVRAVCDALIHRPRRVGTAWGTRDPISALAPVLTGR